MRTGIGYDIHRLIASVEQRQIPLGGVNIPCFYKIEAHSDGDVLLHAIVDACLGALALGDIGQWFPDNDSRNRERPSSEFVQEVKATLKKLGWRVQHIDSNIHLEEPKLSPHIDDIRKNVATLLNIELSSVSVKAKTNEGLGSIGKRKAVAANVIVTLEEVPK